MYLIYSFLMNYMWLSVIFTIIVIIHEYIEEKHSKEDAENGTLFNSDED